MPLSVCSIGRLRWCSMSSSMSSTSRRSANPAFSSTFCSFAGATSSVVMSMSAVVRTAPAAMTAWAPKTYQRTPSSSSAVEMLRRCSATDGGRTLEFLAQDEVGFQILGPGLARVDARPNGFEQGLGERERRIRPVLASEATDGHVLAASRARPVAPKKRAHVLAVQRIHADSPARAAARERERERETKAQSLRAFPSGLTTKETLRRLARLPWLIRSRAASASSLASR